MKVSELEEEIKKHITDFVKAYNQMDAARDRHLSILEINGLNEFKEKDAKQKEAFQRLVDFVGENRNQSVFVKEEYFGFAPEDETTISNEKLAQILLDKYYWKHIMGKS
jgi:hypothetical protein